MKNHRAVAMVFVGLACLALNAASAAETVTVDTFVRAETDMTMKRYAAQGAFGKFLHIRGMTPVDKQDVIRMNRGTAKLTPCGRGFSLPGCRQIAAASSQDAKALRRSLR